MNEIFIDLLNISITASYIIIAVILLRLVFKKIPKKFVCLLWGIAGLRLVFPFSIESALSLIPSTKTIDSVPGSGYGISINSGIPVIDRSANDFLIQTEMAGTNSVTHSVGDILLSVAQAAWIIGIVAIVIYGIISYIKVKKSVSTAVLFNDNVWQSESVVSPFILGVFRPKIYIPFNMDEDTRNYVVAHENAHLRRRDHWIKPLGFLILAVYWFNPLVWIAYVLLCRDIEAACDEKVIAQMDGDTRREYASALLECAVNRRRIAACPLAFGEVSVKNRIKNVMSYKKPAFWVIILAVAACIVAAVCFLTNPETTEYYDCGYVLRVTPGEAEGGYYRLNNGISGKLYGSETFEITEVDLQSSSIELKFSREVLESTDKNFSDDLFSDKEKTGTLKIDFGEKKTVFYSLDNEDKVTFTVEKKQSLDDAITAAIMERSADKYTKGDYACEFHEILSTEAGGDADSNDIEVVTAFISSAYGEYVNKNGVAESIGGNSMPLALTFRVEDTGYSLVEYWMPEDGSEYASSIRDKFPASAAERALNDSGFAAKQCLEKAQAYFNQNQEFVIDINEEREKLEIPVGEKILVPDSLYTVYENRVSSKQSDSWTYFERISNNALIEYDETVEPVNGVLIKSKADFDKFVEKMTPYFELYDASEGMSFMGRAKMFDDEFFQKNSLMVMYVSESTWSVTHTLSDIYRHHQAAPEESRQDSEGYVLSFQVHRNIPGVDDDAESERFITVAMDNAAIGDVHSYYVTYGEDIYAPKETYRYGGNGLINGTVTLYSDNKMMFNFSLLSSYVPYGTYTVDNGKLVMKTDDGRFRYTFKVDGDTLVFDAVNSSELPEYNYGDGTKFKPIPNGAEFVKE